MRRAMWMAFLVMTLALGQAVSAQYESDGLKMGTSGTLDGPAPAGACDGGSPTTRDGSLGPPADSIYARERARLESLGRVIGGHVLLIAAHALPLGCTVVTDNGREFSRVAGLACANWLRGH